MDVLLGIGGHRGNMESQVDGANFDQVELVEDGKGGMSQIEKQPALGEEGHDGERECGTLIKGNADQHVHVADVSQQQEEVVKTGVEVKQQEEVKGESVAQEQQLRNEDRQPQLRFPVVKFEICKERKDEEEYDWRDNLFYHEVLSEVVIDEKELDDDDLYEHEGQRAVPIETVTIDDDSHVSNNEGNNDGVSLGQQLQQQQVEESGCAAVDDAAGQVVDGGQEGELQEDEGKGGVVSVLGESCGPERIIGGISKGSVAVTEETNKMKDGAEDKLSESGLLDGDKLEKPSDAGLLIVDIVSKIGKKSEKLSSECDSSKNHADQTLSNDEQTAILRNRAIMFGVREIAPYSGELVFGFDGYSPDMARSSMLNLYVDAMPKTMDPLNNCKNATRRKMEVALGRNRITRDAIKGGACIGIGKSTRVYKGTMFNRSIAIKDYVMKDVPAEEILKERDIMICLKDKKFICNIIASFHEASPYMLMELCYGSVETLVGQMPSRHRDRYALQILHGLNWMHSHAIIHTSISTRNCLINGRNNLVLSDFGKAVILEGDENVFSRTHRGLHYNQDPESNQFQVYGKSSDVFSAGMVIFTILNNYPLVPRWLSKEQCIRLVLERFPGGSTLSTMPFSSVNYENISAHLSRNVVMEPILVSMLFAVPHSRMRADKLIELANKIRPEFQQEAVLMDDTDGIHYKTTTFNREFSWRDSYSRTKSSDTFLSPFTPHPTIAASNTPAAPSTSLTATAAASPIASPHVAGLRVENKAFLCYYYDEENTLYSDTSTIPPRFIINDGVSFKARIESKGWDRALDKLKMDLASDIRRDVITFAHNKMTSDLMEFHISKYVEDSFKKHMENLRHEAAASLLAPFSPSSIMSYSDFIGYNSDCMAKNKDSRIVGPPPTPTPKYSGVKPDTVFDKPGVVSSSYGGVHGKPVAFVTKTGMNVEAEETAAVQSIKPAVVVAPTSPNQFRPSQKTIVRPTTPSPLNKNVRTSTATETLTDSTLAKPSKAGVLEPSVSVDFSYEPQKTLTAASLQQLSSSATPSAGDSIVSAMVGQSKSLDLGPFSPISSCSSSCSGSGSGSDSVSSKPVNADSEASKMIEPMTKTDHVKKLSFVEPLQQPKLQQQKKCAVVSDMLPHIMPVCLTPSQSAKAKQTPQEQQSQPNQLQKQQHREEEKTSQRDQLVDKSSVQAPTSVPVNDQYLKMFKIPKIKKPETEKPDASHDVDKTGDSKPSATPQSRSAASSATSKKPPNQDKGQKSKESGTCEKKSKEHEYKTETKKKSNKVDDKKNKDQEVHQKNKAENMKCSIPLHTISKKASNTVKRDDPQEPTASFSDHPEPSSSLTDQQRSSKHSSLISDIRDPLSSLKEPQEQSLLISFVRPTRLLSLEMQPEKLQDGGECDYAKVCKKGNVDVCEETGKQLHDKLQKNAHTQPQRKGESSSRSRKLSSLPSPQEAKRDHNKRYRKGSPSPPPQQQNQKPHKRSRNNSPSSAPPQNSKGTHKRSRKLSKSQTKEEQKKRARKASTSTGGNHPAQKVDESRGKQNGTGTSASPQETQAVGSDKMETGPKISNNKGGKWIVCRYCQQEDTKTQDKNAIKRHNRVCSKRPKNRK